MIFELSDAERKLLLSLKEGFSQVLIYGSDYPSIVSFVLANNRAVSIGVRCEDVGPRFEVFPITVTEEVLRLDSAKVVERRVENKPCRISILQKSNWSVPSSLEDKAQMMGETSGATTTYEGKSSDIPGAVIEQATLHAGVEIQCKDGWSFLVATSVFPYTLYVSDCESSESIDPEIYDRIEVYQ